MLVFGCFWFFCCFFVCFCMIWSYIIIFRPLNTKKHHLNPKWADLISSPFMYACRVTMTYLICWSGKRGTRAYSLVRLVRPNTEELISRPFLDENSIWRLFWDRVDPWPAAGCFYSRPLSLLYWISLNCQVPWGWHCIFRWICLQNAKMDLSRAIFFICSTYPPIPNCFALKIRVTF